MVAGFPLSGVTTPLGNTDHHRVQPGDGAGELSHPERQRGAPDGGRQQQPVRDFRGEPGGQRRGPCLEHPGRADRGRRADGGERQSDGVENNLVLNGNVITNDVQGADGAAVTAASLSRTYGGLVLNASGTYITLSPNSPVTSRRRGADRGRVEQQRSVHLHA